MVDVVHVGMLVVVVGVMGWLLRGLLTTTVTDGVVVSKGFILMMGLGVWMMRMKMMDWFSGRGMSDCRVDDYEFRGQNSGH